MYILVVHFTHGGCTIFASSLWCKDANAHALVAHINPYMVTLLIPLLEIILSIKSLHVVFIWKVEAISSVLQVQYMTRREAASTGFAALGHFTAIFGGGGLVVCLVIGTPGLAPGLLAAIWNTSLRACPSSRTKSEPPSGVEAPPPSRQNACRWLLCFHSEPLLALVAQIRAAF